MRISVPELMNKDALNDTKKQLTGGHSSSHKNLVQNLYSDIEEYNTA